jgi:multidrug efflux pump subunit AcrA (membrane-fusion protein)
VKALTSVKGQVLFQIDPQPFQAALDQAKAQLAQAEARLTLAEINVKRDTPLARQRAIAHSQLDSEIADERTAKAAVPTAEAAMEEAGINLDFTHVRSRTEGISSIASTHIGNLVSPSQNPVPIPRGLPLNDQPRLASVPPGPPSQLLERRPDIRQAEERLVAASLTGTAGPQSAALTSLLSSQFRSRDAGGGLV